MAVSFRTKIAKSVSTLDKPEDWVWNRWLKTPAIFTKKFTFAKSKLIEKPAFSKWIEIPTNDGFIVDTLQIYILECREFNKFLRIQATKSIKFVLSQQKSVKYFFGFGAGKSSENIFTNPLAILPDTTLLVAENIPEPQISLIKIQNEITETFLQEKFIYLPDEIISNEINFKINEIETKEFKPKPQPNLNIDFEFPFAETKISEIKILAGKFAELIDDSISSLYLFDLTDYYNSVTPNLISHEYLTKIKPKEQLEKYFLRNVEITSNLLPSHSDVKISDELLSFIPSTYAVELLSNNQFEVEVKEINELIIRNDINGFTSKVYFNENLRNISFKEISKHYSKNIKIEKADVIQHGLNKFTEPDTSENLIQNKFALNFSSTEINDFEIESTSILNFENDEILNLFSASIKFFHLFTNSFSANKYGTFCGIVSSEVLKYKGKLKRGIS